MESDMEIRSAETFTVKSEKDGQVYTTHHREPYIDAPNGALDTALDTYTLGDGRRLRMMDESGDRFEIGETGEFVRRNSRQ